MCDHLVLSQTEAEFALQHLESLGLVAVNVRRGDEAIGLDDRLDNDSLPVSLRRGAVEDHDRPRHGVI